MAQVALAALRLGMVEMEYLDEVPGPVAINEAIEITRTFGDKPLARL